MSGVECVCVSLASARVCPDSGPGDGLRVPVCGYVDIQSPVSTSADGLRVPRNVQCQQCMWAAPGSLQPSRGGMRLPSPATSQEPRQVELSTKFHNIRRRPLPTGTFPAKLITDGGLVVRGLLLTAFYIDIKIVKHCCYRPSRGTIPELS